MSLEAFSRMTSRLFTHVGEVAILAGVVRDPPVLIDIEHDVAITGVDGTVTVARAAATIPIEYPLRTGDSVVVGGNTWICDGLLADDGYTRRYVLRDG